MLIKYKKWYTEKCPLEDFPLEIAPYPNPNPNPGEIF